MQTYFKEVLHVYKGYASYKQALDAEYADAANSGDYNRGYLSRLKAENASKMKKYQNTTEQRLAQIREDYTKELDTRDFLSGMQLSEHLVRLLNSPIKLTERDYKALAERNKDNVTASRALHDSALRDGFVLDNYIPVDTALEKFDIFVDRCQKSMWDYESIPYYVSDDDASTDAGALCAQASRKTFECYRQPKNLEEMLDHDVRKELAKRDNVTAEFGKAFLEGFMGNPVQDSDGNILTEGETLDAMVHSLYSGRGGVISDADIQYIRHDSEYQTLREQNPINDSDLAKMKVAVTSAINQKSIAISNGADESYANELASVTYNTLMNS
jgi:hypothetical protein